MNNYNLFFMSGNWGWAFLLIMIWSLFWKGCSLWISAEKKQGWWFVALLIINSIGILDIIYIFLIAKKKWSDVKGIFSSSKPTV